MSYSVESGQIIGSDGEVYCLAERLGETNSLGACRNPKTYSPRSGFIVGAIGEGENILPPNAETGVLYPVNIIESAIITASAKENGQHAEVRYYAEDTAVQPDDVLVKYVKS